MRPFLWLLVLALCATALYGQTDCNEGTGPLNTDPPKTLSTQEVIQKFLAGEDKAQAARTHYQFTQDVLVQTLSDNTVDGQFHQIAQVSYDSHGTRQEKVTFSEVPTLRGIQLSDTDKDDIRTFMPWILTSGEAAQYNLTYAGQQHVDDLDTYVFQVEPKKIEKNRRYFQGRVWVDNRDFQIAKLCGKSVPDAVPKKKQPQEIRPTFVTYRQIVDGNWFPAYARIDDTLHFRVESVHVREIVKFTDYQRTDAAHVAPKP